MAKIKNSQSQKSERAIFWLGLFTFLITMYFNAQTQDPFNAPKLWILILGASWLIGFIAVKLKKDVILNWGANRNIFLLTGLYLGFSLLSALVLHSPTHHNEPDFLIFCFTLGACSKNGGICSCLFQRIERGKCYMDQYVRARIVCLFLCSWGYDAPAQKVFLWRKESGKSKSKRNKIREVCIYFLLKNK